VKFGMSRRITKRLTELRQTCPIPALMFATVRIGADKEKALRVEKSMHLAFSEKHSTGEWFRFDLSDKADKSSFNKGSQEVLFNFFGVHHPWWEHVSVAALDKHNETRRRAFAHSKHKKKIIAAASYKAKQERAWKELA